MYIYYGCFSYQEEAVDWDNRPGYHHVDKLCEALLKTTTHAIPQRQVDEILACCNALDDYDKKPIKYDPKYSSGTTGGRFAQTRRPTGNFGAADVRR